MSIGSVIVTPDTDGGTVDRPDHRLLRVVDPQADQSTAVTRHADIGLDVAATLGERVAAAAEVGAGAESTTGAGDDHRTHVVVGIGSIERVDQLVHHRAGERVRADRGGSA